MTNIIVQVNFKKKASTEAGALPGRPDQVRTSVVESDAYKALPHRSEYAGTAAIAKDTPQAMVEGEPS